LAKTIRWKIPADLADVAHDVHVYRSIDGENGSYTLSTSISAGGGNTVSTWADGGGQETYFYYVKYVPSGGAELDRILAVLEPGVTEQRLAEQIEGHLPEIVKARIDSNKLDIRKAMDNALATVNAYGTPTSWGFTNLPARLESVTVLLAMVLLYVEKQLQIAIRDYTYGATGVNFTVDRNSKFSSTLQNLTKSLNDLLKYSKLPDMEIAPMGIGTNALSTPQARVFSFLFNS